MGELLQPFASVKNLYLIRDVAPRIALVLQELVGENVMDLFLSCRISSSAAENQTIRKALSSSLPRGSSPVTLYRSLLDVICN